MKHETPITITAVWLRRIGDNVEVLVERDGQWYKAITENVDAPFSWIAEGNGAHRWTLDDVTTQPAERRGTRIIAKDGNLTINGRVIAPIEEANGF